MHWKNISTFAAVAAAALFSSSLQAQATIPEIISPDEIDVEPYSVRPILSSNARWMFYYTNEGAIIARLDNGQRYNGPAAWSFERGSWSPADAAFAFVLHREGKYALQVWAPDKQSGGIPRPGERLVIPRKLYFQEAPVWSPDGGTLFFVIDQNLPWEKSRPEDDDPPTYGNNSLISITKPYLKQKKYPRFEREYPEAYAETNRSLVMALEVASGKVGVLARGNDIRCWPGACSPLSVSPDGQWLAITQRKDSSIPPRFDIYLAKIPKDISALPGIDLENMEERRAGWSDYDGKRLYPSETDVLIEPHGLAWSPNSTHYAYAKVDTCDVYAYEIATRTLRNLTTKLSLAPSNKTLGYGDHFTGKTQKFSAPLWLPDGRELISVGRGEAWIIPLDPAQAPRAVTQALPLETRSILKSVSPGLVAMDLQGHLTVIAKDRISRLDSFWSVDPSTARSVKLADAGMWVGNVTPVTDPANKQVFYSGTAERSVFDLKGVVLKENAAPIPFTENKTKISGRVWPTSETLQWKTADGYIGYGLLYLPIDTLPDKKAPLVVIGYPAKPDSYVDDRASRGALFYARSGVHRYLQQGFAVLYADIPMSDSGVYQQPIKQVVEGVMVAVDRALATGLIDEQRIGIVGTNYGGYMVQAVISHTDRFKAAVSMAGIGDLYVDFARSWHQLGEGRLEKPVWEEPHRYVDNSPLTYWNKVKTPLLLIHGEEDRLVDIARSEETFGMIRTLRGVGIMARYFRMESDIKIEAQRRAEGWLREHLLGEKPTSHISEQGSFFFGE